ncbi:peptide/nickel transport system ATP-binding protein [Humitalea rosea]|uniref:Peptide/nickel transport system ATP-binding protein n=1 Tax=Humitalea rosea TaxID=990373 RepID=A0A2W7ITK4_9PROT|nr:ABC transporter ATP-binding protein [Humitalea rosea]PZW50844.1 peptide/nickel transport system ATP-binding protein [Humitalea rosea]
MMPPLLEISQLAVTLPGGGALAEILDDVTLKVPAGCITGVVGESGCGKSTLLRAILGILPRHAQTPRGGIFFEGHDILPDRAAGVRGRIGFVPQDPYLSLNPLFRAGDQILEIMRRHAKGSRAEHKARLVELFRAVQLPDPEAALRKYPHEFSGGQRQRLLIAAALSCEPRLVVADEPTTALDVTTQREILGLLRELTRARGLSMLFVTHDFGVLASLCDDVAVLYAGRVAETGPTRAVLDAPAHPYTRMLLACHPDRAADLAGIPGAVPPATAQPSGCRFHPRCPLARESCAREVPVLQPIPGGRAVACPFHAEALPELALV